ncbi:hypothetical protein IQ07DRAFT_587935, partial [Pyrenochaeta sp. DS3sAY3a]
MNGNPPAPVAPNAPAAPAAANGQQQQLLPARRRRPRPAADPLRKPRRPLQNITRPMVSLTQMNETKKPPPGPAGDDSKTKDALRQEYLAQGASTFPLVVTRRDLKELRHHVMRLQSKAPLDITSPDQFTPPIRLHRRDPRAPPSGAGSHFEEEETKEDIEEIKERERIEQQKEVRRKVREENQAKIAPTGTKKPAAFQKKTEQKYRPDDTPEAKKRQLLRYEETLPWHLEDFENKQTWVGTYESELSEAHIMLSTSNPQDPHNSAILLAPMERWYRFNVKGKVKATGDDADKEKDKELVKGKEKKDKKSKGIASFLEDREAQAEKRERKAAEAAARPYLSTRVGGGADDEGRIRRIRDDYGDGGYVKQEADADDIDHEDDFADDEEGLNGLFEGEEQDVKAAEEKLKRDQLQASLWERPDEERLQEKEEEERRQAEELRALEKATRKTLAKREKQYEYLDSDPENPYITESESDTDSETERQRAKEEEEKKLAEQNGKAADGANVPSGASTKGSNTPSGNHKPVDLKNKKRPGSPNLSEASGNESSRKKQKKNRDKDGSRKSMLKGAGSGSDSEMTDADKLKSDADRLNKMKKKKERKEKGRILLSGSPSGSPGPSRAGSPSAGSPLSGSRAGSPAAPAKPSIPSAKEIHDSLPPQGMNIQNLIAKFKGRVDKTNSQTFIRLVKAVSSFDKQKSWLTPLEKMPSEEHINTFMNAANAPK